MTRHDKTRQNKNNKTQDNTTSRRRDTKSPRQLQDNHKVAKKTGQDKTRRSHDRRQSEGKRRQ